MRWIPAYVRGDNPAGDRTAGVSVAGGSAFVREGLNWDGMSGKSSALHLTAGSDPSVLLTLRLFSQVEAEHQTLPPVRLRLRRSLGRQ